MTAVKPRFLSLDEACEAGPGVVGGKAFALGQLGAIGISVPRAAVLLVDTSADFSLSDELFAALETAGLAAVPLAVRSSALEEDGTRHSFAGIHSSVLNVVGRDATEKAVRRVVASYDSATARAYRDRIGIAPAGPKAAVLLCEMVGAPDGLPVCAGVAFTCDPVSGSLDHVVVELVPGIADKLVDGSATPHRAHIALRSGEIVADAAFGGLLPDDRLRELVRTALRIEWALNDGDDLRRYDIEWAYDGARLFIVQARPVTTLDAADRLPVEQIWSQANLTEVLPGILSPFSWSLNRPGIRWVLLEPFKAAGDDVPENLTLVKRVDGRPFIELSALQWLGWVNFGTPPASINENLGGEQPEIALSSRRPGIAEMLKRGRQALGLLRQLMRLDARLAPRFVEIRQAVGVYTDRSLADRDRAEVAEAWRQLTDLSLGIPLGLAASAAVPWLTMAHALLDPRLGPDGTRALIGGLMAGRRGTVSAEHAYLLARLGRLTDASAKIAARADFLERFGHRGFDELELENPRWRDNPAALQALERQLAAAPDMTDRIALRAREAAAGLAKLSWWRRPLARFFARKIAAGFAIREEARSESVRLLGAFRMLALDVGHRLSVDGKLTVPEDVFLLTAPDLMAYLEGDWDGSGADRLAASRRAQRDYWYSLPNPPAIIRSSGANDAAMPPPDQDFGLGDHALQGIGVSPGQASGAARIIRDPREAAHFAPGDILVARATDPAWTPLFLTAGAIVVENGGYLSHGAIIAREFGIPAVVNLPGVLERLSDGQQLCVDGSQGRVSWAA